VAPVMSMNAEALCDFIFNLSADELIEFAVHPLYGAEIVEHLHRCSRCQRHAGKLIRATDLSFIAVDQELARKG
jgi:hypothetical protein